MNIGFHVTPLGYSRVQWTENGSFERFPRPFQSNSCLRTVSYGVDDGSIYDVNYEWDHRMYHRRNRRMPLRRAHNSDQETYFHFTISFGPQLGKFFIFEYFSYCIDN